MLKFEATTFHMGSARTKRFICDLFPNYFILPGQDTLFLVRLSAEAGGQVPAFEHVVFGERNSPSSNSPAWQRFPSPGRWWQIEGCLFQLADNAVVLLAVTPLAAVLYPRGGCISIVM